MDKANELVELLNRKIAERAREIRSAIEQSFGPLEQGSNVVSTDDVAPFLGGDGFPAPSTTGPDAGVLIRCIRQIDDERNQVAILRLLLTSAREFAERACIFIVRGDGLSGWAATGFTGNGTVTDEQVKATSVALTSDTILKRVVDSQVGVICPGSEQADNRALFESLGGLEPAEIASFPLFNRGRVAGVVYVDSGSTGQLASGDAVDILTRTATNAVDLLPARAKQAPPPAAAAAAPAAAPAAQEQPRAAVEAAPAPAAAPAPKPVAAPAADISDLPPEEQKLHEAAKRFARLLVSEIKLYNEAKVNEGRTNRDIYDRLKDDIDRSLQMYTQRVNPKIAESTSYFHEEIVKTLAQGDRALLGAYPY